MNKSTFFKILKYLGKYKYLLIMSVIFSAISVLLSLYVPILVGDAIDLIVGKNNVQLSAVKMILVKSIGIVAFTALLQWVCANLNNKTAYGIIKNVRKEAFSKLHRLPLNYLDTHSKGETLSRIISDTEQFADGLLLGFTQFFSGIVTIVATLVFMLLLSWKTALVVVVLTPLSLIIANFIAKSTYSLFKKQSETRGEQTAYMDEMIGSVKTVQAFSQREKVNAEFKEINDRLEKHSLKAIFFSSLTNPSTRFVNSLVYACVALFGALAVPTSMSVGGLTIFLSYANKYTVPFNEISGVIAEMQNAIACASRVFDLIEEQEQPEENKNVLGSVQGNVELNDVAFSYTKEKQLIKNLSLSAPAGTRVAIVGPTGCGKTTLINLLMRFYDVNEGEISVDGADIRDITRHSLRSSYGMVLQDTWLFSGTIRENIAFAREEATEEEIINAAKAAHAHSFIKRMPDGYDTVIGEDGGSLSQGQKQLLCIARIMLSLPPMLILDEATSSIDTRTEQKIQSAFQTLMKGRTSFIVAHRLSTIQSADMILVMKDGNVIEQGTHNELLEKQGFYYQLYNSQFEVN